MHDLNRERPGHRAFALFAVLGMLALLAVGFGSSAIAGESQTEGVGAVFGTVRGPEGEPLEGVEFVVKRGDEEVGDAATDENGQWSVSVPGGEAYQVELITDSLPEGVTVREDQNTREVTVGEGRRQAVIFPLVSGEGGAVEDVADRFLTGTSGRVINLIIDGIRFGAIIAITSIGLSLIFGVTGLINFAHGELVLFGAVVAYYLNNWGPGPELPLIVAGGIAVVAGGGFGWTLERGLFRPLRKHKTGALALLLVTIGLSIAVRHVVLIFLGGATFNYGDYQLQRELSVGSVGMTPKDMWILGLSLIVMVGVGLMLQRTRLGTAMRAVADNRDLAESSGIDVQRVILATWVGGGALAAFGGVMQGLSSNIQWTMGFNLLLLMFAGVIVGGLGTAYGAMVGGIVIGVVVQVSTLYSTELKLGFGFLLLVVVLLVRPQGILGRKERIG